MITSYWDFLNITKLLILFWFSSFTFADDFCPTPHRSELKRYTSDGDPLSRVEPDTYDIHQQSSTEKAYIGVYTSDCYVNGVAGVYVTGFRPNSPAKKYGMRVGDIIRRYRGMTVNQSSGLTWLIECTPLDTTADIEVERNNEIVVNGVLPTVISRTENRKLSDAAAPSCEVFY
ncbi:MAG: PDZ domain-containing protein [Chitinophagaceae bacterium]|jgi:C-terminal processing protease CtpA/Prc|nr:PDZ domain-containing protein [Chitinophagaceae bacterium]